jgi:hypothetical protein
MENRRCGRECLNIIGAIILLVGLGSALLIHLSAREDSSSDLGYQDGYPVMPDDSKQYLRGLALYGGTANVLADEFRRWLAGLWHDGSLAFPVLCIAILVSSRVFYVANRLPSRYKSDERGDNNRGSSG